MMMHMEMSGTENESMKHVVEAGGGGEGELLEVYIFYRHIHILLKRSLR